MQISPSIRLIHCGHMRDNDMVLDVHVLSHDVWFASSLCNVINLILVDKRQDRRGVVFAATTGNAGDRYYTPKYQSLWHAKHASTAYHQPEVWYINQAISGSFSIKYLESYLYVLFYISVLVHFDPCKNNCDYNYYLAKQIIIANKKLKTNNYYYSI